MILVVNLHFFAAVDAILGAMVMSHTHTKV